MKCPYCNSEKIEEGIVVFDSKTPSMEIGLMYRENQFKYNTLPLYVDLCTDCGSIVRMYVKGNVKDKKWEKEIWRFM